MNNGTWILVEVDDKGRAFDDENAIWPAQYFDDRDHDGDAAPAAAAALVAKFPRCEFGLAYLQVRG
ncbi:hypothetical protein [Nocardia transvalensis]|uniref:hypothetical protein n=1 Tax=Nocardia transvalensis TaxID=37333 RepID=UPI001895509D|nr:hypothetical protein [Nocardia transvalensis]MBF6333245.1 hypothetical protein [Nocardia transvalensis]